MHKWWKQEEEGSGQVNGVRARCNSLATRGNNCPVNNTSIVASRGELARNNCAVRETPALSTVDKKNKTAANANGTRAKLHHQFPKQQQSSNEVAASVDRDKSQNQRPIRKSFSVPDYLRESTYLQSYTFAVFASPFLQIHESWYEIVDTKEETGGTRFPCLPIFSAGSGLSGLRLKTENTRDVWNRYYQREWSLSRFLGDAEDRSESDRGRHFEEIVRFPLESHPLCR